MVGRPPVGLPVDFALGFSEASWAPSLFEPFDAFVPIEPFEPFELFEIPSDFFGVLDALVPIAAIYPRISPLP
ncbi:MAG: hypothetical protein NVS3B20_20430 [Polyangiales bacterium]